MIYLVLKTIHVFAVVLFLGNIILGNFWMAHAAKSKNPRYISYAMKVIIKSDQWFTLPGVLLILAAGFGAAIHTRMPLLRTGWIFWSIVLFTMSGVAFGWKVAPLQQRIYRMTALAMDDKIENFQWDVFNRYYRQWKIWGFVALITPLGALCLMVLKVPATTMFFR